MVTLKGAKLLHISIEDKGEETKVEGTYALVSSEDKILAKQPFNGYSDLKIPLSAETLKALDAFKASLGRDINAQLGF